MGGGVPYSVSWGKIKEKYRGKYGNLPEYSPGSSALLPHPYINGESSTGIKDTPLVLLRTYSVPIRDSLLDAKFYTYPLCSTEYTSTEWPISCSRHSSETCTNRGLSGFARINEHVQDTFNYIRITKYIYAVTDTTSTEDSEPSRQ